MQKEEIILVFPRFRYPSSDFSLGLAWVASFAREKIKDINISILDTTFHPSFDYVKDTFNKKRPAIVGIYTDTLLFPDALKVASLAKEKGACVILGGPHPTIMPEISLNSPSVDAVCIGEGEITFSEYIEAFRKKRGYDGICGLWVKTDGKILKNPPREPILDLDTLPLPAVDLFELDKYTNRFVQLDSYNSNLSGISIIASRGCPFQCTYCQPTLKMIFGKKVRIRSPQNVVEELKGLVKKYKIEAFYFQDDTLTIFSDWLHKFASLLQKEGLGLVFALNTRADTVDYETLKVLRGAGMVKLKVGIESISNRIRNDIYKKKISQKDITRLLAWCRELDIQVTGFFMLGAPTETLKEVWQTIKFASFSSLIEANFSITTPFPKTDLFELAKEKGWHLPKNFSEFDYYQVKRPKMSKEEIEIFWLKVSKKAANLIFYLHPIRIIATLKSIFTSKGIKKLFLKLRRI